jgi:hypothetical protein
MKRIVLLVIALATGLSVAPAFGGGLDASAVLTSTPVGSDFENSITLTNSSTDTPVGTFWFGWVPGKDFLATMPTGITTPTGWTDAVTHGGATDGYAIMFVAGTGDALAPGSSLSGFGFTSADTPGELAGNSVFYPTFRDTTAFAYIGKAFGDPGQQFVVTVSSVPEPSSLILGLFGLVTTAGYCQFKKRKRIA